MLTSLYLENFRAFGAATNIPLAPITLLFGENSSGKTSVLHALTLLKQTQEAENKQAALVSRGLVDLGSFEEYIFDHDTDRELTIGIASQLIRSEQAH
jgi:AAA15 family ATPase/GTPase